MSDSLTYFAHPTAVIDEGCSIGDGSKIWHFSHLMELAEIGKNCNIGQNVFIANNVDDGTPASMGGFDAAVTIPNIGITFATGTAMKAELEAA